MEEILKFILSSTLGATLAYLFAVSGKKKDVDIQKTKELNVVLSHMLNTWYYLTRLDCLLGMLEERDNGLVIPKEILPYIFFKSDLLNDNCFVELEKSVETLRQYDPVTYFELEGIGKRFDFLRSSYVVPFLKGSNNGNEAGQRLSRNFLDKLLNDIENYLRTTAQLISKETHRQIERKLDTPSIDEIAELKEEINLEFYNMFMSLLPPTSVKPSFEDFMNEIKNPEVQAALLSQFQIVMTNDINQFLTVVAENPSLTMEELQNLLKR